MVNRKKESLDDEKHEPRVRNRAQIEKANNRVRAEDALKESETRFRSVVESAVNAVVLADSSGTIISWNKSAEKIFLYAEEEVLDKPLTILMPERYREAHVAEMNHVTLTGELNLIGKTVEMYGLKKDGTEFPLELSLATWKTQQGTFYSGIIHDITERKKAEEERERLSRHNKMIFDSVGEGIYGVDMEGKTTFINPVAAGMLGYEAEELIGKPAHGAMHHTKQDGTPYPKEECPTCAVLKTGVAYSLVDEVFWRRDGTSFPVEYTCTPVIERGKTAGAVVVFRDATERKKAEEALKESERRYRLLFENMLHGLAYCRMLFEDGKPQDFIYLDVNSAFEKLTGLKNVVGRRVTEVIPGIREAHPELFEVYGRVALTGQPERFELYFKPLEFWLSLSIYSMEKGYFVAVFDNITERKQAEELHFENLRLEAADKAKSEFLANMSHELRTPLNASIGFSEFLKLGMAGELSEKQNHFVDNILTSSQFLLSLINDILDLSKIEAGKIELAPERMSVPVTIKETLSLIKEKAMKHNVLLKTEFDPELEFIEADKQRFKQILFNLLSNAVKFSKEEGGAVTIRAKKEGDMAQISVLDTGIGIREENVGKLFQKFEQLESGISRKYGGTGLGLSISKQLVELHGGKIWAESRYGEWSVFTFTLPLKAKGGS